MDYIQIGKIAATFGVVGEMVLVHAMGKKLTFKKGDTLFVEKVKNSYVPFFIHTCKAKTATESIIAFEDIITKEKAKLLVTKHVWLLEEKFATLVGKNSAIGLVGYTVIENDAIIGEVQEVIEQPHQVLLKIQYQGNEAFIPLHEETLLKVDRKKKIIVVTLPSGLLDIYKS